MSVSLIYAVTCVKIQMVPLPVYVWMDMWLVTISGPVKVHKNMLSHLGRIVCLQWNLSNLDSNGTDESVLKSVSLIEGC